VERRAGRCGLDIMMLLNGLDTYSLYAARKSRNSCVL
jgi:hypothetical protein